MEDTTQGKVKSPEQLNEYIRLTKPGVWILLVAVVFLLIGAFIWGIYGKIDTKLQTVAVSDGESAYVYVREEDFSKVRNGMAVRLGDDGMELKIDSIPEYPEKITEELDEYARHIGGLEVGEWAYKCRLGNQIAEGTYQADIIVESISPITFIIN